MPRYFMNSIGRYRRNRVKDDLDRWDFNVLVTRSGRNIRRASLKLPHKRVPSWSPPLTSIAVETSNSLETWKHRENTNTLDSLSFVTQYKLGLCQLYNADHDLGNDGVRNIDGRLDLYTVDGARFYGTSNSRDADSVVRKEIATNFANSTANSGFVPIGNVENSEIKHFIVHSADRNHAQFFKAVNANSHVQHPECGQFSCTAKSIDDIKALLSAKKTVSSIKVYTLKQGHINVDASRMPAPFKILHIKIADNQETAKNSDGNTIGNTVHSVSRATNTIICNENNLKPKTDFLCLGATGSNNKNSVPLVKQGVDQCPMCFRVFSVTSEFSAHLLTHIKSRNRCSICSKVFTRSWLLKGHMRTHTGERPFICPHPDCAKAFADKSNLRSHMRIHDVTHKSYLCKNCGRAFAQNRYLHKHVQEVCGKVANVTDLKRNILTPPHLSLAQQQL